MKVGSFMDVLGGLLAIALVTTLVAHKNTASVIAALGSAFSGAVKAAQGR